MFQAIDVSTNLSVILVPHKNEDDLFEFLEALLKKRFELSARGKAFLASGKSITKAMILERYQIKYAEGAWIRMENDIFLPDERVCVVFYLKQKNQQYEAPISGVFEDRIRQFEYDINSIQEFMVLPQRPDEE